MIPTIFVDMDSTLNNLIPFFLKRIPPHQRKHGVMSTNIERHFIDEMQDNGAPAFVEKTFCDPLFWRNIPPKPHAYDTLQQLKNNFNCNLIIASNSFFPARTPTFDPKTYDMVQTEKRRWVQTYFPNIFDDFVFIKEKYRLKGDIIIDDYQGAVIGPNNERFPGIWVKFFNTEFETACKCDEADVVITEWPQLLELRNAWIWCGPQKTDQQSFFPEKNNWLDKQETQDHPDIPEPSESPSKEGLVVEVWGRSTPRAIQDEVYATLTERLIHKDPLVSSAINRLNSATRSIRLNDERKKDRLVYCCFVNAQNVMKFNETLDEQKLEYKFPMSLITSTSDKELYVVGFYVPTKGECVSKYRFKVIKAIKGEICKDLAGKTLTSGELDAVEGVITLRNFV